MPGGGSETSTSTNEPWIGSRPYLLGDPRKGIPGVLPEAAAQYQSSRPAYFPGSTVAAMAPESEIALEGTANRALSGSPLTAAAGDYTMDVLGGGYLNEGNPYLDAVSDRILGKVRNQVESRFGAAGRTGSGLEAINMADLGAEALAPYYFGDYENQLGRMDRAAQFTPTLAGLDYLDLNALLGVGDRRQQQGQAELTDEVNRHNFEQNIDAEKLRRYADMIRGISGQYGTTTQTVPGPSPFQQLAGAALGVGSFFV